MTSSGPSRRLVRTTLHGRGASPSPDGCLVDGTSYRRPFFCLFQIRERVAEALQADRDADACLRRVEDDEHGGPSAHHLLDHLFLYHHLGDAPLLAAFDDE